MVTNNPPLPQDNGGPEKWTFEHARPFILMNLIIAKIPDADIRSRCAAFGSEHGNAKRPEALDKAKMEKDEREIIGMWVKYMQTKTKEIIEAIRMNQEPRESEYRRHGV